MKAPKYNMRDHVLLFEGIARAQRIARREGLLIGRTVAHPSSTLAYRLDKIHKGVATVSLEAPRAPRLKRIEKHFPLRELYDPNVAADEARDWANKQIAKVFTVSTNAVAWPGDRVPRIV